MREAMRLALNRCSGDAASTAGSLLAVMRCTARLLICTLWLTRVRVVGGQTSCTAVFDSGERANGYYWLSPGDGHTG